MAELSFCEDILKNVMNILLCVKLTLSGIHDEIDSDTITE
jgi:hypothetical protein